MVKMTEQEYFAKTGYKPVNDDLDRVNCDDAGLPGHWNCGWCDIHRCPRFSCLCRAPEPKEVFKSITDGYLHAITHTEMSLAEYMGFRSILSGFAWEFFQPMLIDSPDDAFTVVLEAGGEKFIIAECVNMERAFNILATNEHYQLEARICTNQWVVI
jgi:hypothetical protein